jgi:hypothetical protein
MNLYIETENGSPKNHPAFEENLLQAFSFIPDNWILFERIQKPLLDTYDVFDQENPKYQLIGGVYKDVWMIRPMTDGEKLTKQQSVKDSWDNRFPSWVFNEVLCKFEPPIQYPQDDKQYYWDEPTINWVEVKNEQNP